MTKAKQIAAAVYSGDHSATRDRSFGYIEQVAFNDLGKAFRRTRNSGGKWTTWEWWPEVGFVTRLDETPHKYPATIKGLHQTVLIKTTGKALVPTY